MHSILGRVADSTGNTLLNASSRSLSSRVISTAQWSAKRWICQRCYRLNQHVLGSKPTKLTDSLVLRSQRSQHIELQKYPFSTSLRQADSAHANHVPNNPRTDLPSQEEGRRSHVSKRFSHLMDQIQSNVFIAGQRLNDLTGYSGIEALKKDIEQQEQLVQTTRSSVQSAREAYSKAINQRSGSQREVNELLQRKHAWSAEDLERFTALYRSDHANEQAEAAAQENLAAAERQAEEAAARLSSSILARYHEEQIWSDKIRRMSTWGTWGLMGVNILLFLVFQVAVEPWRRKRLVKGFEDKVMEALEREGSVAGASSVNTEVSQDPPPMEYHDDTEVSQNPATVKSNDDALLEPVAKEPLGKMALLAEELPEPNSLGPEAQNVAKPETSSAMPMSRLESISESFRDMFSERQITLRRVDLTTAMLEGTAAGVAFVGVLVLLLRPR